MSPVEHDADRCAYVVGRDGLARLAGPPAEAWSGLQRVHRDLTRRLESASVERHELSLSALELLGRLAAAPDRCQRLARLANEVGLSLSRVSRLVDTLERRGLVERRRCQDDARATEAHLTTAGLALARKAHADHVADVQRAFVDRLDDDELRTLAAVFTRLTTAPVSSLRVGEQDAAKRFRAGVFGRAAATYDQVGAPLAALFGQRLVEIAGMGEGDRVLDVACGRGAVLVPAAETVGSGGRVIGIDLAAEMVELAADELRRRGLENAEVRVADGERLDGFAAGEFDCVACAFALFFFPDPAGALAEFRRVLRPGGTVAISTWGKEDPRHGWYFALLKEFDVQVRMMTTPFDEAGQLAEALTTAGFEAITTESERHVVRLADPETWWRWALSAGARAHIESLEPPARERFKRMAFQRLRETYEDGPIELAADALFTVGHAPRE